MASSGQQATTCQPTEPRTSPCTLYTLYELYIFWAVPLNIIGNLPSIQIQNYCLPMKCLSSYILELTINFSQLLILTSTHAYLTCLYQILKFTTFPSDIKMIQILY